MKAKEGHHRGLKSLCLAQCDLFLEDMKKESSGALLCERKSPATARSRTKSSQSITKMRQSFIIDVPSSHRAMA